jgi:electron transport complex protein RnfG
MKKFVQESWLVLVLGVAIAVGLGATQAALDPQIQRNKQADLEKAIFEVVPNTKKFEQKTAGLQTVYACLDDKGTLLGWALPASGFGFQDKISTVIGLNADGSRVTGLYILDNKETPGLGNIIEKAQWRGQYVGLDATTAVQVIKGKRKDVAHEIEAITGATISSNAVTKILNESVAQIRPKLAQLK